MAMVPKLEHILDLEYLASIDDGIADAQAREDLKARDREIYEKICSEAGTPPDKEAASHGPMALHDMDETRLLFSWLEYRKLVVLAQGGPKALMGLPGKILVRRARLLAGLCLAGGLSLGFVLAFSFLAYHGTTPVNVALFLSLFVLLPFVFSLAGLRFMVGGVGRGLPGGALWGRLASRFLFRSPLDKRGEDAPDPAWSGLFEPGDTPMGTHLYWSLVGLSTLSGVALSLGFLGGTFFRVAVSDLAFGWQSTLVATAQKVHGLVTALALPWAWALPSDQFPGLAHPTLDQIAGSRIILKEGIDALVTTDLVSWWPFLCFSLVFYTVLPRLLLWGYAHWAGRSARRDLDLGRPVFRRLLARMKRPHVAVRFRETAVTRPASDSHPLSFADQPSPKAPVGDTDVGDKEGAGNRVTAPVDQAQCPARLLFPQEIWTPEARERVGALVAGQFHLAPVSLAEVAMDADVDGAAMGPSPDKGPLLLVQEVWQPPIRGLLYYVTRLREITDCPVWVVLVQGADEPRLGVSPGDVDARVWARAVKDLKDPGLMVEFLEDV